MAKVSRSKLKGLIKECLIEILTEGVSTGVKKVPVAKRRVNEVVARRTPALDNIRFEENVSAVVSQITDDPMMASIFADTASTTLQEQLDAEQRGGSSMPSGNMDSAMYQASNSDPMDLFADVADNWATLAFDGKETS
jgi:hypothetical protein